MRIIVCILYSRLALVRHIHIDEMDFRCRLLVEACLILVDKLEHLLGLLDADILAADIQRICRCGINEDDVGAFSAMDNH